MVCGCTTHPIDPHSGPVSSAADHESPEDYILRRLTDQDAPPPAPKDPTNTITAEHLLQDKPTPLIRLWDHHRRLLARFQSLIRQVRQLQRQEHEPFLKEKRDRQRRQKEDHAFIDQYLDQVHQRNKQQPARTCQNLPARTTPTPQKQNEPTQSAIRNPQSAINSLSVSSVSSVAEPPNQNEPTPLSKPAKPLEPDAP